jgi:hypothetical protein
MRQRLLILAVSAALGLSTLGLAPLGLASSLAEARGGGQDKCTETQKGPGTKGQFTTCPKKGNPHNSITVKGNENTLKGNNPHNKCNAFNKGQEKKCN